MKAICPKCGKRLYYFDKDTKTLKGKLVHTPCHIQKNQRQE